MATITHKVSTDWKTPRQVSRSNKRIHQQRQISSQNQPSIDHDPSNIFVPSMTAPTNIPTAGGVPIGAPVTAARERRESESGTRPTAPANNDHKFAFAASPRTKHNTQTNYHASRAPDLSAGPATYSPAAQERAEQTTNAGVGSSPVRSTPAVHGREGSAGSLSSASQLSESPSRSVSTASAASSAATTSSSLSGADNDGAGKGSRSIRFEALPSRGN